MNNIFCDIETIPCQSEEYRKQVRENITAPAKYKKPESIERWIAESGDAAADEIIAKTSFDPALGHICCIGVALEDGEPFDYSDEGDIQNERGMIYEFFDRLPTMGVNRFIGHYISGFDLRFILCRAVVLGVKLPPSVAFPRDIKPWSDSVFDTMVAWSGAKGSISQDNLCRALGLETKGDFDGSMVAEAWANGEHERISEYCRHDVETVRAIFNKFEQARY